MFKLIRTNSDHPDFRKLVVLLDHDLAIRDGAEHAFYAQFNKIDLIRHAVVAYQNNEAVGCGAFKEFEKDEPGEEVIENEFLNENEKVFSM